jgi:mono/diheme cytochrome c family protein
MNSIETSRSLLPESLCRPLSKLSRTVTLLTLGALMAWPHGHAAAQNAGESVPDALQGARIFRAAGCGGCHSVRGMGGGEAPDLGRAAEAATFYALAADNQPDE